ncbi:hypothetical protein CRUP_036165 [Coryphaenoides rupestris]|nr:hypothetical protein CRUP_036165 [Coryphaenoides rupestris]
MRCDILQSVCRLAALSFCCALLTVRESDSTFVPGRCVCPVTQSRVRGILKGLRVIVKNPICDQDTVILNRDVRNCLRRKRRMRLQKPPTQQRRGSGQKREPRSLPAFS